MIWAISLALSSALFACEGRDKNLEIRPEIVARTKLGNELLFVDRTDGMVHAVDVMGKHLTSSAVRIDIPANPITAIERPNTQEVLILCAGARDSNDEWLDEPALVVLDKKHQLRRYPLSVPLSAISLSSDGKYALLYSDQSEQVAKDLLSNPNRVALIDLDESPSSKNPTERTLKAPGGALRTVTLTEPLEIVGQSRPIALFKFDDGISVWDMSHPERAEITSEGLGYSKSVVLRRVVTDASNGTIYLIQSGLSDLRVLDLNIATTGKENDFWPSWNQLPLDSAGATDLVLYQEKNEPRVLVAVGNDVRIIDSNDSRVVSIQVPQTVSQFYAFKGGSPRDATSRSRILGFSPGSSKVIFIELSDLESRGTRNMEAVELGNAIKRVLPLESTKLLTEFISGGIGVLDLESRRFTPLTANVELTAPLIESDANRVWVAAQGDVRIGYFEPDSLKTGEVRLDSPVKDLYLFENENDRKVVVSHDSDWGQVTVVDTKQATRSKSIVLDGFLLDGLVKR
jgi:hypothetical protein